MILHNHSFILQDDGVFGKYRIRAGSVLESPFFDQAIGLVIFANAVTIGLESSARVERWSDSITVPLTMLEHAFLCVYTIEVLLRFFVFSWQCLVDTWVKFDCFLVFIG